MKSNFYDKLLWNIITKNTQNKAFKPRLHFYPKFPTIKFAKIKFKPTFKRFKPLFSF